MAINAQELQGQWNQLRGQVKEKWGQLTEDDLQIHGGNVDQLVGKIQQKTGEGREAVETFLHGLTQKSASAVSQAAGRISEVASKASDSFRETYSQAADRAREGYDQATDVVKHNPGQSVATAFGIGIVVGVLVGISLKSR